MTANLTLTYGSLNLTASPYLVEFGTDLGAPQNEDVALAFFLQDGEVELSSRASNRTITFNVLIEGASLTALATAEAALLAETEKPLNTLTVDPGDGAPATVFDIFRGSVSLVRDDSWEIARMRRYTVTVRALPFPHSVSETVTPALAASGTTTTNVDNGSATTNWTSTSGTVNVSSGAVGVTTSAQSGTVTVNLTRTASITTSTTKFLVIDYRPTVGGDVRPHSVTDLRVYGDGTELPRIASTTVNATTYRATFYVAASSISVLRLDLLTENQGTTTADGVAVARTLYVDNIDRSDIRPLIGTARQQMRSLTLTGSAPTPGSLTIEHATTALGDVLVYTWRKPENGADLYVPAMRPYRSAGTGTLTTNSALVSGSQDALTNGQTITYDIPMSALPTGLYVPMIRAAGGVAGNVPAAVISWSAQTRIGSTAIGTALTGSGTMSLSGGAGPTYSINPLGRVTLPATDVRDPSTGTLRVVLTNNSGADIIIDELWFFNQTVGQLVQVACGTGAGASGGPSKRLFISAPTVARPRPQILRGDAADGSDAFHDGVQAWQFPQFYPPVVNVFTVTTGVTGADVSFRSFPRWHTNAAS